MSDIKKQAQLIVEELIEKAELHEGQLLVVGCSSSEITGGVIGHDSSPETAVLVMEGILPVLKEKKIFLAAQCCEHLNRALIVEREAMEKFGFEEVSVVPKPKAGGSFATAAWEAFSSPVAVEHVSAHAGLDIGLTLIGMHLRHVAVPIRLSVETLGEARITAAKTRPKYIGGERAHYA